MNVMQFMMRLELGRNEVMSRALTEIDIRDLMPWYKRPWYRLILWRKRRAAVKATIREIDARNARTKSEQPPVNAASVQVLDLSKGSGGGSSQS